MARLKEFCLALWKLYRCWKLRPRPDRPSSNQQQRQQGQKVLEEMYHPNGRKLCVQTFTRDDSSAESILPVTNCIQTTQGAKVHVESSVPPGRTFGVRNRRSGHTARSKPNSPIHPVYGSSRPTRVSLAISCIPSMPPGGKQNNDALLSACRMCLWVPRLPLGGKGGLSGPPLCSFSKL